MPRRTWYAAAAGRWPVPSAAAAAAGSPAGHGPPATLGAVRCADPRSRHRVLSRPRGARSAERAGLHPARGTLSPARPRDGRQRRPGPRGGERAPLARAPQRAERSRRFGVLASSLLGQHRFAEALEVGPRAAGRRTRPRSRRAGSWPRPSSSSGATRRPDGSSACCASYQGDLGVAPRLARWEELRGRPEEARRLLRQAQRRRRPRHGMPREQVAWFHLRLGDLALRTGQLGEAQRELEAGLRILPRDYRLLGALARLDARAARLAPRHRRGELAIAQALDPATLGLLHDAWTALGDTRQGRRVLPRHGARGAPAAGPVPSRVESLPARPRPRGTAGARERRGRAPHPPRRLRLRPARLGAPQVGQGRRGRGRRCARALGLGTRDAMLLLSRRHDRPRRWATPRPRARRLETALAINPYWHPTQPAGARALLDSLAR